MFKGSIWRVSCSWLDYEDCTPCLIGGVPHQPSGPQYVYNHKGKLCVWVMKEGKPKLKKVKGHHGKRNLCHSACVPRIYSFGSSQIRDNGWGSGNKTQDSQRAANVYLDITTTCQTIDTICRCTKVRNRSTSLLLLQAEFFPISTNNFPVAVNVEMLGWD